MNVLLVNLGLTTRPLRDVTVAARYRMYDLENDTPEHTFTNVLNPGDLTPARHQQHSHQRTPGVPQAERGRRTCRGGSLRPLTLRAGYEYEQWNRKHRETDSTHENIGKAVVDLQPWSWLLARLQYSHGVRVDQRDIRAAGRKRHRAPAIPEVRPGGPHPATRAMSCLQITPIDTLTLSGSFYIAERQLLQHHVRSCNGAQALGYSVDVSWAPLERLNLYAGYAHDLLQIESAELRHRRGAADALRPAEQLCRGTSGHLWTWSTPALTSSSSRAYSISASAIVLLRAKQILVLEHAGWRGDRRTRVCARRGEHVPHFQRGRTLLPHQGVDPEARVTSTSGTTKRTSRPTRSSRRWLPSPERPPRRICAPSCSARSTLPTRGDIVALSLVYRF